MRIRKPKPQMGTAATWFWILCFVLLNGWLWPYIGNSWLEYHGKAPQIAWWQGALIGFVPYLNKFVIPLAVITWFMMMLLK